MRAIPSVEVTVARFGVWRFAVLGLAVLSAACVLSLPATRPEAPPGWLVAAAGAAAMGVIWIGVSLARIAPVRLRWDGQLWHLGAPAPAVAEPRRGTLTVAVDLGAWLLLRFEAEPEPARRFRRPAVTWLPVQRRGLEANWHALRCAAHAPRPSPGADPSADAGTGVE